MFVSCVYRNTTYELLGFCAVLRVQYEQSCSNYYIKYLSILNNELTEYNRNRSQLQLGTHHPDTHQPDMLD